MQLHGTSSDRIFIYNFFLDFILFQIRNSFLKNDWIGHDNLNGIYFEIRNFFITITELQT